MKDFLGGQFYVQDEITEKKQRTDKQEAAIGTKRAYLAEQAKSFDQRFCIPQQEHDVCKFLQKVSFADKLVFIPDGKILGKGINTTIRECKIFIRQGEDVYTYHLDDETRLFNAIPQDVIFIIVGDADLYIAVGPEGENKSVYRLPEDVVLAAFIETNKYKRLHYFYAYAVRDTMRDYCICNVSSDSRVGMDMYRIFATVVESDLERSGLGQ